MHPIKNFRCAGASACVTHTPSFSCQQLGVEGHGLLPGHAGETRVWLQNVSHTLIILPGPRGGAVRGGAGSALSILCNHPAQLNDVSLVARGHKAREGRQNLLGSARVQRWTWWPQWLRAGENLGHAAWGSGSFLRVNPHPNSAAHLSQTFLPRLPPPPAQSVTGPPLWSQQVGQTGFICLEGSSWHSGGRRSQTRPCRSLRQEGQRGACADVKWAGAALPALTLS